MTGPLTQVTVDGEKFNMTTSKAESLIESEHLPASMSGEKLSEAHTISHLNECPINKLTPLGWRMRTSVAYAGEGGIEVNVQSRSTLFFIR